MKRLFYLLLFSSLISFGQSNKKTITGRVSDGREVLQNVTVSIDGSNILTTTDEKGFYTIEAAPGDIINYEHQGLKPLQIVVEDVTRVLNPTLYPDVEELDEVVVVGNNRKSQKDLAMEYAVNPRIIRTAYGYLNADTAPGNVRFLDTEQIRPIGICILDVLRGYFAGVSVGGNCQEGGAVFIRGVGSISNARSAIYDVDGQIFTQAPIWLDVFNMRRIAVLNNFATVTQYGSIATGGVVVINTIGGNKKSGKIVDYARLDNNYFDENDILDEDRILRNSPNYLQELVASENSEQAKKLFEEWKVKFGSSPYFLLDSYRYFYDVRNDKAFADAIIENNFGKFENNAVLLKALAYHYEAQQRFDEAHGIYKAVYKLRPNYSQSYIDLVNSYRNVGEMKKAATIYSRYKYLQNEEMMNNDTTEFTPIIKREYNNLLTLHRGKFLDSKKSSELFIMPEDFRGTRLVFEWNDGEAEFHLQFVNPGDQYFTFKHSLAENSELIMREKMQGYSTSEYLIDDSLPGRWKVNATYLGNKSLTPSYLKATVYYNYGTSAQRKEIMLFKLDIKGRNVALFELSSGSSRAAK